MIQKSNIWNKNSLWLVANIFFTEPTIPHFLKEISKKCNLAHTATKHHLNTLLKQQLITQQKEKKGKRYFPLYKANTTLHTFKFYKKINNLLKLEESKLIPFLKDTIQPKSIILFGSYVRGEDTETSDIDIFIEATKDNTLNLKPFEKKLNRSIELHWNANFQNYPKELKNNILQGIILEGYVEAFP